MTSQWPDDCDASTSEVASNSLDIYFIHGDMHGQTKTISQVEVTLNEKNTVWGRNYSHNLGLYDVLSMTYCGRY